MRKQNSIIRILIFVFAALIALLVLLGGGGAFAYMQLKGKKQQIELTERCHMAVCSVSARRCYQHQCLERGRPGRAVSGDDTAKSFHAPSCYRL